MKFTIDEKLWAIDDPRVDQLHAGELSVTGFVRVAKPTDPWQSGFLKRVDAESELMLTVYDEAGLNKLAERKEQGMRNMISRTGGISGRMIWDHAAEFLHAYPELKNKMAEVQAVIDKQKCKGCALNSRTKPLAETLLALPPKEDRDFSKLSAILSESALTRLRTGQPLPLDGIKMAPDKNAKQLLPLRAEPLAEPHKLVWIKPGEKELMGGQVAPGPGAPKGIVEKLHTAMRPACFDCCRKHLAQAIVLLTESKQGYPAHRWLSVGHLAEAAEEIMEKDVGMADSIRAERLAVMSRPDYMPQLLDLIDRVTELDEAEKLDLPPVQ